VGVLLALLQHLVLVYVPLAIQDSIHQQMQTHALHVKQINILRFHQPLINAVTVNIVQAVSGGVAVEVQVQEAAQYVQDLPTHHQYRKSTICIVLYKHILML
jgi:hypothetical protein